MTEAEPPPWSFPVTTNMITAPICTTHTSSDSPLGPFFNVHAPTCPAREVLPEIEAQMVSIREHLRQIKHQQETPRQPIPCDITAQFMTDFKADLSRYKASIFAVLETIARAPVKRHRRHCASTRSGSNPLTLQSHSCPPLDPLTPVATMPYPLQTALRQYLLELLPG